MDEIWIDQQFLNDLEDSVWEHELDALGTNAATEKYIEMLEKAPEFCKSKQMLTNFIQSRMSA